MPKLNKGSRNRRRSVFFIGQRDVRFFISDDYSTRYSFEINGFNGFNEGVEEYGW